MPVSTNKKKENTEKNSTAIIIIVMMLSLGATTFGERPPPAAAVAAGSASPSSSSWESVHAPGQGGESDRAEGEAQEECMMPHGGIMAATQRSMGDGDAPVDSGEGHVGLAGHAVQCRRLQHPGKKKSTRSRVFLVSLSQTRAVTTLCVFLWRARARTHARTHACMRAGT